MPPKTLKPRGGKKVDWVFDNCHNCGQPKIHDRQWIEKGAIWIEHSCGNCPPKKWASFTKKFKDPEFARALSKFARQQENR